MQVVKGGGGMDLFVNFKIVKIVVYIKTRDLVLPLTNAHLILSSDILIGGLIGNLKTRRRCKTLKTLRG
jgi:hypothetical protein